MVKLDIGCGPNKKEGFIGIDQIDFGQDLVHDIRNGIPYKEDEVEEVYSSHFVEHLTAEERINFFNELYRVMKAGAKCTIIVPHWSSSRAYGDLTHQWPPVVEFFWYYLNKDWRAVNAPHVPFACDFEATWGYSISPAWTSRNQESQTFGLTHYREVAQDIICTITKK